MRRKGKRSSDDAILTDPRAYGALCDECPLQDCPGPVFGQGPRTARIAVIGESPEGFDVDAKTPFVGISGQLLERELSRVGVKRTEIYIDNAVLEMPDRGNLKNFLITSKRELKERYRSPIDLCRPRLFGFLGIRRCSTCRGFESGPVITR